MGHSFRARLILLSIMLAAVGFIANLEKSIGNKRFEPASSLNDILTEIPNWGLSKKISLQDSIREALQLNDYANFVYHNKTGEVVLYIGQYFSNNKIGAAHDPLVCYPGQGWKVINRQKGNLTIVKTDYNHKVSYSSMVAELMDRKIFVLYWFQSHDSTYSNTFFQKLSSLWNGLTGKGQANAFVRVSTPLKDKDMQAARNRIFQFINDFYPVYLNYITSNH